MSVLLIAAAVAVASVSAAAYYAYKHYGTQAVLATVKAEIAKIEADLQLLAPLTIKAAAMADVNKVISRLKALL